MDLLMNLSKHRQYFAHVKDSADRRYTGVMCFLIFFFLFFLIAFDFTVNLSAFVTAILAAGINASKV